MNKILTICILFEKKIWRFIVFLYFCSKYLLVLNTKKIFKMNKVELVEKMAAKAGMTKADAKRALDAFLESTQECLKKGESLTLIGFGSFGVSKRAARTGHNPQKPSETIKIPAKNVVRFSAGATLKKAVNSKKK